MLQYSKVLPASKSRGTSSKLSIQSAGESLASWSVSSWGMPEVWINTSCRVTGCQGDGQLEIYVQIGLCTLSFPCCCKIKIDIAVNSFVTEPRKKRVSGVFGV